MRNWMKVFASTTFAAVGSLVQAISVYGQGFPPIATNCIIIADEVFIDDQFFVSGGTMDLLPGEVSPPGEQAWMQLINIEFFAQSQDPTLGIVTWQLDYFRPVTTSIIRSDRLFDLFPATIQLDFHVVATISSQPDHVFLSRTPISISTRSPLVPENQMVWSWPPDDIELGSVDADGNGVPEPVEFFDVFTNETAFIVNRLRSRVID